MTEHLIIRILGSGPYLEVQWVLFRSGVRAAACETALPFTSAFAGLPGLRDASRAVTALVPGVDVLLTHVMIPPTQRRHRNQVVPFLMEERLAEDIAQLHLAAAEEDDAGRTPVAAVNKDLMRGWIDALDQAGIRPDIVIPEMLALPHPAPGQWMLAYGEGGVWLRTGPAVGVAMEWPLLSALLPAMMAAEPPQTINAVIGGTDAESSALAELCASVDTHIERSSLSVLDWLAGACLRNLEDGLPSPLTLLQGQFAPARRANERKAASKLYKAAAAFFLAALLLEGVQGFYFSHRAQSIRGQIDGLYVSAFPGDTRIVDPVQQTKNHLKAMQAPDGEGFLALLEQTAGRAGADHPIDVQSLSYSEDSHALTMDINAPTLENLNELERRLDGGVLNARLVSVNKSTALVEARFSVEHK